MCFLINFLTLRPVQGREAGTGSDFSNGASGDAFVAHGVADAMIEAVW
jgi:hypothetical protein